MRGSPSGPLESFAVSQTIDFASVASVTAPDQAIAVPGTLAGDTVLCSPQGTWPAGLTLPQGRCLVDGTVQFRIANVTAGALDPASQVCLLTILRVRT